MDDVVLVVGPGPLRPGVQDGASVLAAEVAARYAASGARVVVLDSAPTSALLLERPGSRTYVAPLSARTVVELAARERVTRVELAFGGGALAEALAEGGEGEAASAARRARAPSRREPSEPGASLVDAVVATDGTRAAPLAWFSVDAAAADAGLAPGDAGHTTAADHLADAATRAVAALPAGAVGEPGLVAVRVALRRGADGVVVGVDALDPALWWTTERALEAKGFLGLPAVHVALRRGASLDDALATVPPPSSRGRVRRAAVFDLARYPGVAPKGGRPIALGGRVEDDARGERGDAAPAARAARRVLVVGPSDVSAEAGAEASAAARLAALEARRLGAEVVLATRREGVVSPRSGVRVVPTDDPTEVRALARSFDATDVLLGFGAPRATRDALRDLATDVPHDEALDAPDAAVEVNDADAVELHVLALAREGEALVLGAFEHVEPRLVHARDAAAVSPPFVLGERMVRAAEARARAVVVGAAARGLVTARFSVPRPSRAAASSGAGEPALRGVEAGLGAHGLALLLAEPGALARVVDVALGEPLPSTAGVAPSGVTVLEHVFPFRALGAATTRLDRSPRSTGSLVGLGETVATAYARALEAMGVAVERPDDVGARRVLLAGEARDASALADLARRLFALGFELAAHGPAADLLARLRVPHAVLGEAAGAAFGAEGPPVGAVVATGDGDVARALRSEALGRGVAYFSTAELAEVLVRALEARLPTAPRALEDTAAHGPPAA